MVAGSPAVGAELFFDSHSQVLRIDGTEYALSRDGGDTFSLACKSEQPHDGEAAVVELSCDDGLGRVAVYPKEYEAVIFGGFLFYAGDI